jgi:hypothetical protein
VLARPWVSGTALAVALVLLLLGAVAMAHGDPLSDWAEHTDIVMPLHQKPYPTAVVDGFVPDLVAGGVRAATPCSGTVWVYDYAHGIAGSRHHDDTTGGTLEYRAKPPVAVPSRDLLVVHSQLGLHLGIALADAAKILKVPISAAFSTPNGGSVLYVNHDASCGNYRCGNQVTMSFVRDRAVFMSIHHSGP